MLVADCFYHLAIPYQVPPHGTWWFELVRKTVGFNYWDKIGAGHVIGNDEVVITEDFECYFF